MRPARQSIDRTQFDAERELDEVVGRYEPNAGERWQVRYGKWIARALVALCLAVAAAAGIALIFDRHMRAAEHAAEAAPKPVRPVIVDILPARK